MIKNIGWVNAFLGFFIMLEHLDAFQITLFNRHIECA